MLAAIEFTKTQLLFAGACKLFEVSKKFEGVKFSLTSSEEAFMLVIGSHVIMSSAIASTERDKISVLSSS